MDVPEPEQTPFTAVTAQTSKLARVSSVLLFSLYPRALILFSSTMPALEDFRNPERSFGEVKRNQQAQSPYKQIHPLTHQPLLQ